MEDRYKSHDKCDLDKEWRNAKLSDLVNKVIQIDSCNKKSKRHCDNIRWKMKR